MTVVVSIVIIVSFFYVVFSLSEKRKIESDIFIESYTFPLAVKEKVIKTYPHLSVNDLELVITGLREYFHICNATGRSAVSMPSQVVDVAWHEFILFTRIYEDFCTHAFRRFLHHTPAQTMQSPTVAQHGIKLAWRLACSRESIKPESPTHLPLLFAMDARLDICDGFKYSLDCLQPESHPYCAAHIGCGGGGGSCGGGGAGCGGGCGGCGGGG